MFTRRSVVSGFFASCLPLASKGQARAAAPIDLLDGWEVVEPAEVNLDPNALTELAALIDEGVNYPNVHSVLVEHHGRLVFEHYKSGSDSTFIGAKYFFERPLGNIEHGPTTLHDLRSVTKSVTSLLMGIALRDAGEEVLKHSIEAFIPDRSLEGKLESVTLHEVLTMTAGFEWNETTSSFNRRNDLYRLLQTFDPAGYLLTKDLEGKPGEDWNYNSGLVELSASIIEFLTEMPLATFAEDALFGPLGINDYEWVVPESWSRNSFPSAANGLRLRPRDLAKIASLILQKGKWHGHQVVPADWVKVSTSRHVQNVPWGPPGVYGFGYFWYPGTLSSGHKVIQAIGWGDQRIFVLPELGLAITIFAGNYRDGGGLVGDLILNHIVQAVR